MKPMSIAVCALLVAAPAAMAQTQTTPPTISPPHAAADRAKTSDDQAAFYTRQDGEFRANDLLGATVRNTANEDIGEIDELVISPDGQIMAAVVGVGGFLGIGERDVALSFKSLRIERDRSAMTQQGSFIARVNATKETLQNAPEWQDPTTPTGGRTNGSSTPQTNK